MLDKDPRNVQAQILLGNIYAGMKDIDGAVKQIEEAIQIDPLRGATYTNLGVLRLAQGQRDSARAAFDKAVEVDPKSVQARLITLVIRSEPGDLAAISEEVYTVPALSVSEEAVGRVLSV